MTREIETRRDGGVVTLTLNRPDSHNALTPTMIQEITSLFGQLAADEQVRLIVLTGRGRSFCAGADLGFMRAAADYDDAANVADSEAIFDMLLAVDSFPRPVVGRINGAAIGGGAGLTSCCDSVVAVSWATFAFSEARLGLAPAVISPFVLAKIGPGHARELFLSGERFKAAKAQKIGLVHHLARDEAELDRIVQDRIEQYLEAAPGAQEAAKQLIRTVAGQPYEDVRHYTANLIAARRASAEGREGMSAFLEKRKAAWQRSD